MPLLALACAGVLSASLAAAPALDVGLVTEARARTTETPPGAPQRTYEGELSPWIKLGLGWRRLELSADYRPLLTLSDAAGGTATVLHQASVLGRWQRDPDWLVSAQLTGRLGDISGLQLIQATGTSGGPAQLVPTLAPIGYRFVEATLGFGVSASPRHRLLATLAATEEGGATAADQRWLPRQGRLHGVLGLEWEAGPHDVAATTLDLEATEFSTGPAAGVALLLETWRHVSSPSLRLWVGAGPAAAAQRVAGVTTTALRPGAEAGLAYDGRAGSLPVTGRLVVTVAPVVDRVTGAVPERAGLVAALAVKPSRAWRLEGTGSAGRVLEGLQKDDQAWTATAKVGRSLGEFLELAVGARGLLQRQPRFATNSLDWHAFLALEVHTRRPDPVVPDPSAVKDPLRPGPEGRPEEH